MQPLKVSKSIISVSEFKTKAAEWLRQLTETKEPLVITQNGKAAAVILSPAVFDLLTEQARFVHAVGQGIEDLDGDRIHTHEEIIAEMKDRFGKIND